MWHSVNSFVVLLIKDVKMFIKKSGPIHEVLKVSYQQIKELKNYADYSCTRVSNIVLVCMFARLSDSLVKMLNCVVVVVVFVFDVSSNCVGVVFFFGSANI